MSLDIQLSRLFQNRTVLGISLMLLGLALYPISDAVIKHLMNDYPVHQITFLRGLTRLIPLFSACFLCGGPRSILATKNPKKHAIRLLINLAYTYAFIYSFSTGSLTEIYTLSYTSPFFMVVLGSFLLKEKIPLDRWCAVGIGLIGIVIATYRGSDLFQLGALLVLLATFLGALNKILMRGLSFTEHSLSIAIYPNIVMVLMTFPFIFSTWVSISWQDCGLFLIVGILAAGGQYAIAQALQLAQTSVLASMDYSTFFWVVALDFVWWNKIPEKHTLIGSIIIIGSNLYILYRGKKIIPDPILDQEN